MFSTQIKYHTKEDALKYVATQDMELKYCSPSLQNDEDVVMKAIKNNSRAFKYASDQLWANKDFIIKALKEKSVNAFWLIKYGTSAIKSNIEIMALAIEKDMNGEAFALAEGEAAMSKELAAKALFFHGSSYNKKDCRRWENLHPELKKFFPKDCWYEVAQAYLLQLEQAKAVMGGCGENDSVVW